MQPSTIQQLNHYKRLFFLIFSFIVSTSCNAQCPSNLDFENGDFNGWVCLTGSVADVNGQNVISLTTQPGPVVGQHTMLSAIPGDGVDEYGGFPKNCPNGSGHSIKLGNDRAGGLAEGLLYQFTIPATSNKFTLTYNYAVVFEDPGHEVEKQPRLEIEIRDLTDDETLECFSFTYVADNSLPGFLISPLRPNATAVLYKSWTANTVYLNGYQGKQIGLYMRTADCTYSIHFGYAYLDVSSKCNNSFAGETYCAGDTAVEVTAPFGYQTYRWYNINYSQLLGSQQVLRLAPPPVSGTSLAVELVPYPGYGCRDTLLVELRDTLTAVANAGPDQVSCNFTPVRLGTSGEAGVKYSWSPAYGLNDPAQANPLALPAVDTTYILTVQSVGGGCYSTDTVRVTVRNIDDRLELVSGDSVSCAYITQPPVLSVQPATSIQWYRNDVLIPGATQTNYTVNSSGRYKAALINAVCANPVTTRNIEIVIDTPAIGINYPVIDVAYNFPIELQARNFNGDVLWTPEIYLDDRRSYRPYFKSYEEQLYTIQIRNETGCVTVDTQLVKTHKEIAIYVPTIFTPNNDGLNDFLRPLLLGFDKVNYFRVFDRWGTLLFVSSNDFPGWNGRFKNNVQESQTVVWMLEAIDVDGKKHFKKGTTLLMH